jgi:lipoate-protein ligase A
MAADRYLMHSCVESQEIIVRFYQWQPSAISIGCMQNAEALLDLQAMARAGVDWVSRPTGGRAVLHQDDVTYSCIFPATIAELGSTVAETFAIISRCLIRGFSLAGIECEAHDSLLDRNAIRRDVALPCFLSPNRDELMVAGRKLVGSAQKRTAQAVLQHGSIPLGPAFRDLPRYQRMSEKEQDTLVRLLERKCTCVAEKCPAVTTIRLVESLIAGFREELCGLMAGCQFRE